jgi:hypothetical protein
MSSELREALNVAIDASTPEAEYPIWPTPRRGAGGTIARLARRPLGWLLGFLTVVVGTAFGMQLANWLTAH